MIRNWPAVKSKMQAKIVCRTADYFSRLRQASGVLQSPAGGTSRTAVNVPFFDGVAAGSAGS
jgi:hypothetical protein